MTELLVDDKNRVFSFDGILGAQVWESSPVTRFRFKKPQTNEWVAERLRANYPTCGIVFEGVPHIGTSDGFIYTPDRKIQRIPEIFVDPEIFIDEYSFADDRERKTFRLLKSGERGLGKVCAMKDGALAHRVFDIDETFRKVVAQERNIDGYLSERFGRLSIRGFVVETPRGLGEAVLYDGSLLGICETLRGKQKNELAPLALYQIDASRAGFVPLDNRKFNFKDGIEAETSVPCVDYRSLWTLDGQRRLVDGICPRDGSGMAPAMFATNRDDYNETTAISHGNHPWYVLDIKVNNNNGERKSWQIRLDPGDLPRRLMIKDAVVYGFYGDHVTNHSTGKVVFDCDDGIRSVADSGLVAVADGDRTLIYNPFTHKPLDSLPGKYRFLSATPQ